MMISGAEAGRGYLDLYDATGDRVYLAAAVRIADTYVKRQRGDGTWPLKVDNRTGEPAADIDLIPSVVISFLDRLTTRYAGGAGDAGAGADVTAARIRAYAAARDRAVRWVRANPARTFNWQAQFDDAKLRGPYQNLSKHEACEFAGYLFQHARDRRDSDGNGGGGGEADVALAEEILRFAEDQFVVWERPPALRPRFENLASRHWITPCSAEQYAMFEPISGSSAFVIVAYVGAARATGDGTYLAKADSLANALTLAQQRHGGRYPTRMVDQDLLYWLNSTVNTARAMKLLAEAEAATPPAKERPFPVR
jgi:maltose/maltodextrin transport system substrate-binding protein